MSVFSRLYRGETKIDFIGHRKRWYAVSVLIIVLCIASMVFRGFNFGIEFAGGSQFVVAAKDGTSLSQMRETVEGQHVEVSTAQVAGTGGSRKYVIRTADLSEAKTVEVRRALATAGKVAPEDVTTSKVSSSWGQSVTRKALLALGVFLVLVSAYLWIRFESKMAIAAILALLNDLVFTAGIYSLLGFEVTPATVIGFLTILGFSLYDTVVVFDKLEENTKGLLGSSRYTYSEAANLAVNQTLMRSINTSLIAILPVAGLLFVGVGVLGVGTLKDLALVLFAGILTGAYSSLFLATPWLVDLKRLDPRYRAHEQRVLAKRAGTLTGKGSKKKAAATAEAADATTAEGDEAELAEDSEPVTAGAGSPAPRPGARPAQKRKGKASPRPRQGKRRH